MTSTNIPKIPDEIIDRRNKYLKLAASLEEKYRNREENVINSHNDAIKNLALISGAIATFSLMLLDSDIPKINNLLILGSAFLLLDSMLSFLYFFVINDNTSKKIREDQELYFKPVEEILKRFEELKDGNISLQEYELHENTMKEKIKITKGKSLKNGTTIQKDYSSEYIGSIFLIAVIWIIMGLLGPYMFK